MKGIITIFTMATILTSCTTQGKLVTKDGIKYYQAEDGSLHTGQVEDYYTELECENCDEIDQLQTKY